VSNGIFTIASMKHKFQYSWNRSLEDRDLNLILNYYEYYE